MATLANLNPNLPDDILTEILIKLPVKSLLRFISVSKSWESLISSQEFCKTHLTNSKSSSYLKHKRVMFKDSTGNFKHCSLTGLLRETPVVESIDTDLSYTVNFSERLKFSRSYSKLDWVGSCDGLVCLVVDKKELILWNPSVRKSVKLPDSGIEIKNGVVCNYGFGFDKSRGDYKVVAFCYGSTHTSNGIVKIFSLKSGVWKRISDCKGRWMTNDPATFANGKLYWLVETKGDGKPNGAGNVVQDIAYLDLETEEYGLFERPSNVEGRFNALSVGCNGYLYVICFPDHGTDIDVLMVESCTVGKENWTKVGSMFYYYMFRGKKLISYVLENGEMLLLCGSKVLFYDKKECTPRWPRIGRSGYCLAAGTYVESMVSPCLSKT